MNIVTQLKQLRLHGMSRSWQALMETRKHYELSFTEGMEMLIQAEQDEKGNKRFERLKECPLPVPGLISRIEYGYFQRS